MGKLEIAAVLKAARNFRGYTQADAANATGLTYQAISNFERGTNRVEAIILDKLCSFYRISVDSVLNAKDWDQDYIEDFLHARSDEERREILRYCGPCARFICEYNDYLRVKEDNPATPPRYNILKIAGRDGSFIEKRLTDKDLETLSSLLSHFPDASEDL